MFNILSQLGLSNYDIFVLIISPILGLIGAFTHAFYIDENWAKSPNLEYTEQTAKEEKKTRLSTHSKNKRGYWISSRLILGFVVGFAIALFFIGTINETATAVSKISLIALIGGFSSHKILNYLNSGDVSKIVSILKEKV